MRVPVALGVTLGVILACWWGGAQARELQGADLARRLGCFACHSRPGGRARPLDGVGARLDRRKLKIAITFPRQLHPGVKMPSYAYLTPAEQESLVHYLESLK